MKNIFTLLAVLFIILCGCTGCREKQTKDRFGAQHVIDINKPADISIDDFITDIDTVRLEVTDESLMKPICLMRIMDDRFYIMTSDLSTVFIFDLTGKYIAKINDRGQGPKEYISILNFMTDPVNKRIIVTDNFSSKILVYDKDGRQTDVIKLDFHPYMIAPYRDGYIHFPVKPLSIRYENPKMQNFQIHFLDSRGKFVSSTLEHELTKKVIGGSMNFQYDILENGDILYQPLLGYTVYKISGNTVIPYYEFNNQSGYKTMTKKQIRDIEYADMGKPSPLKEMERQGYLITQGEVIDMKDYAVFIFSGEDKLRYLYYSKETSKSLFVDPDLVKGDKNTKKFFFNYLFTVKDDRFYMSPSDYMMYLLNGNIDFNSDKLREFLKNTDVDSNPLIVSFKIKFPQD